LEFLNEQWLPCIDGELGQIVVTDFFNRKMPLIRYAIGDLAAPTVCPCGKIPLPALTQLLGKTRGLLKHTNGSVVISTAFSPNIRDIAGISQYQVEQITIDEFTIRLVALEGANIATIESQLLALFVKNFGNTIRLRYEWCLEVPRLPGGKYMEFIGLSV
jgi:phenylacetate-CoA ligase